MWINPKIEWPREGEIVWILMQHWKKEGTLSCEIYCGEVEYSNDKLHCRAFNNDYIGAGGVSWTIWQDEKYEYQRSDSDVAVAWTYCKNIQLPDWV